MTAPETLGLGFAISAAIDILLRSPQKRAIAIWMERLAHDAKPMGWVADAFLNRIFGGRILSIKSFKVSVFISIISLLLGYAVAFFTSDFQLVYIFDRISLSTALSFIIFMAACVASDFVSISQTRIFVRAMDSVKNDVVSIGLAIGDAFVSLFIFVLYFSASRLICYLIVISVLQPSIASYSILDQDALSALSKELKFDAAHNKEMNLLSKMSNYSERDAEKIVDQIRRIYSEKYGVDFANKIILESKIYCTRERADLAIGQDAGSQMIWNFIALGENIDYSSPEYEMGKRYLNFKMRELDGAGRPCGKRLISVKQHIPISAYINAAGFYNAAWTSFERTMFDFYGSVSFKFSNYIYFDAREDLGAFATALASQSSTGFLIGNVNAPSLNLLCHDCSYVASEAPSIRIPFSPMLMSSLTATIIVMVYVFSMYVSRLIVVISRLAQRVISFINIEYAPLTFVCVAASTIWVGLATADGLINMIWELVT